MTKLKAAIDKILKFKYNRAMYQENENTYIVTFEIASQDTITAIRDYLKTTYSTYCPIHKYCWAIITKHSAVEIRNDLSKLIQPSDRLFVIRSGTEAAWKNSYGEDHNKWLKKNL